MIAQKPRGTSADAVALAAGRDAERPGQASCQAVLNSPGKGSLQFAPVARQGKGQTILIVDDEPFLVRTTGLILEDIGYRALTALSGSEALAIFRQNRQRISLVLLDLSMSGMSGEQTFDGLREIAPDVRVLISSGHGVEGKVSALLERGCSGFIQKPFDVATLSAKLAELLPPERGC